MNSLRNVVILWFLVSVTLLLAVLGLSVAWSGPLLVYSSLNHFGGGLISYAAHQVVTAYEAEGAPGVTQFELATSSGGIRGALLDRNFQVLREPSPPLATAAAMAALARSATIGAPKFQVVPNAILGATVVQSRSGEPFYVVLEFPRAFLAQMRVPWGGILLRGSLLLAGVALLCSWLAYRITAPLLRLRASTRAFAGGDLAARSGPGSRSAVREIRELAGDFDDMADRIQSLVDSQTRLLQYVSHEIRTPLTRLHLSIGEARRQGPSPSLDRIEGEAERLNSLVQRILQLSRVEVASQPLSMKKIELADFLETIVADGDFEAQASGKHVVLAAADAGLISGDRDWLRGAFENVIRNAIRYTPAGGTVTVTARATGGEYIIHVEDTGPGLPPGKEREIFEPFFRIGDGHGEGFGLGLAISRRVTEVHGGQIRATNRAEGGLDVEFRLRLPG